MSATVLRSLMQYQIRDSDSIQVICLLFLATQMAVSSKTTDSGAYGDRAIDYLFEMSNRPLEFHADLDRGAVASDSVVRSLRLHLPVCVSLSRVHHLGTQLPTTALRYFVQQFPRQLGTSTMILQDHT